MYCLVRFRRKEGVPAQHELIHAKGAKVVEIAVIIVEVVLLLMFSMPVWSSLKTKAASDIKDAVQVRVVAEQFAWNFHYPGKDGVFGKTNVKLVDAGNPIGLDRSDPYAKDDIVSREMRLPVNRDIVAHLTSKDVIHSFGVHVLRVKQDVIPGMEIPIWFKVTKTSEEMRQIEAEPMPVDKASWYPSYVAVEDVKGADGTVLLNKGDAVTDEAATKLQAAGVNEVRLSDRDPIEIACSQLCGLGHYRMKGIMTSVTEAEFEQWLAERAPQTAAAPTAPPVQAPAPFQQPAPESSEQPAPAPSDQPAPSSSEQAPPGGGEPSAADQATPHEP